MIISWAEKAWEDYLYWQQMDRKILKRINALIKDIARHPFEGLGDPEPLKHNWAGYWSRRIDREHHHRSVPVPLLKTFFFNPR